MKKEYQMTEEQYNKIIEASKPVPYLVFGGHPPSSPQDNANAAWRNLANEMGFIWDSVEPGRSKKHFLATPNK